MAFRNAQQARIYVGSFAASCYARTVSLDDSVDMLDVTTICDAAKAYIPGTEGSGSFSIAGPLDSDGAATGQWATLTAQKAATTPTPITYMPLGTDGAVWLVAGVHTNFDTTASVGNTIDWSMQSSTTGVLDMNATVLSNNVAVTTTTSGSSIDGTAATTNGAVFHLHVTAFSGLTSDTITIEDSSTGSSGWATIATFAAATALTSERVAITGTVKRYVRIVDTIVGTGSITRHISMARR